MTWLEEGRCHRVGAGTRRRLGRRDEEGHTHCPSLFRARTRLRNLDWWNRIQTRGVERGEMEWNRGHMVWTVSCVAGAVVACESRDNVSV